MYQQRTRPVTMRDREAGIDESRPMFVRGHNATPKALGNDDVSWAIAEELEAMLIREGVPNAKNAAWLFKRGADSLDRSILRKAYSKHPERFRDGTGRQLSLAEFGRNMVRYFKRHSDWQYANGADDVIGMFYDPVMINACARGLWRVYSDRRTQRGE